jgi:S1-C subfamily serine protease
MKNVFLRFRCGLALSAAFLLSPLAVADLPTVSEEVRQAEQQRIEVIRRACRATAAIFPGNSASGGGSGVIISPDGYALTNFHVAQPCGNYLRCGLNDGQLYDAVIVGIDPTGDVALIQLLGRDDFPTAELGDSDQLQAGDWCFVAGNPFLLATDFQPSVSFGIVSGVHRYQYPAGTLLEYADCIQTDAAINPGNSGGPLFNAAGQLVGINGRGSFEKRGRVNVGVGYAITIRQITNFLGYLKSGRIVDHATLGAIVDTDEDGRVVVTNIVESSDAYRRGLRYGDELVAFAGRPISTANDFKNVLGIFPKGWRLPLSYRRDGQRVDTLVRLAGVHSSEELIQKTQQNVEPPAPRPDREDPQEPAPDQPPTPRRPRFGPHSAPRPLPAAVAERFEAKRGYANYHFNRIQRDRVWNALSSRGDFAQPNATWTMRGMLNDGTTLQVELDDRQALARIASPTGDREVLLDVRDDLSQQRLPEGSGGLLTALHLWRRLLTLGPAQYGEVYYLGTAPWPEHERLADVLVGVNDVVETHFYADSTSGALVGLEMYPDSGVDPCELYFRDYRSIDGRQVPFELEIRYGDTVYGVWRLESFTTTLPAAEDL